MEEREKKLQISTSISTQTHIKEKKLVDHSHNSYRNMEN